MSGCEPHELCKPGSKGHTLHNNVRGAHDQLYYTESHCSNIILNDITKSFEGY